MEPGRQNITEEDDLAPGTLLGRTEAQVAYALRSGALEPQPVEAELLRQDGFSFVIWRSMRQRRKEKHRQPPAIAGASFNPFLPYDPDLFVANLSETHLCLLNKYNVYHNHLLVVTRAFEEQTTWLTPADVAALWRCMQEIDGLGFFNGGKDAGASQRHKHLQLVPFPLSPDGTAVPLDPALETAVFHHHIGRVSGFPFAHALVRLEAGRETAVSLFHHYQQLLTAVGLHDGTVAQGGAQAGPYNLLLTRRWMLLVPRLHAKHHGISVNSLGFAGSMLARDDEQLALIHQLGPMNILRGVGVPLWENKRPLRQPTADDPLHNLFRPRLSLLSTNRSRS